VGVPELGHHQGLYAARWYWVDEAAAYGSELDPLPREVGDGMVGAGGSRWLYR